MRKLALSLALCAACFVSLHAATGTVMPSFHILNIGSSGQPLKQRGNWHLQICAPFGEGFGHAECQNAAVSTGVVGLNSSGSPSAISLGVMAVGVDPIYGMQLGGTRTHISKKSSEIVQPFVAHSYPTSAVNWILLIVLVIATVLCATPRRIFRRICASVRPSSFYKFVIFKTAATSAMAASKAFAIHYRVATAFAQALPRGSAFSSRKVFGSCDYGQSSKNASGKVFRLGHFTRIVSVKAIAVPVIAVAVVLAVPVSAAVGTVMPNPLFTGTDQNGTILSAGKLCTYLAGTTTPADTYFDVDLASGHKNTNPVILNSRGQAVVFLVPGQTYKFTLLSAGTTQDCSTGTTQWTQDNVSAVPPSNSNLDITGTFGTGTNAGQAVYLSDGSGSLNSGQWYPANAANAYGSTTGPIGFATATVAQGASGSIRLAGVMTALSGLSVGSTYYISASSSGSITSTAPVNNQRIMGRADTTSSLVMNGNPDQPPINISACNGRLTLTTGVPVTTADVTAAGTVFFTPYQGNRCALFDGTFWTTRTFTQVSVAVPAVASKMYDVFFEDTAGTLGIEVLAWTNDTTRATALANQDGVLVKTGDLTRRYLGSFRTTSTPSQTEDSLAFRGVWNNYNRVARSLRVQESTASWTYTTATFRQANASVANQVVVIVGVAEDWLSLNLVGSASNSSATVDISVAIGDNSTTAAAANSVVGTVTEIGAVAANSGVNVRASYTVAPSVGYHPYVWLEKSGSGGTTTWSGTTSSGLTGIWRN